MKQYFCLIFAVFSFFFAAGQTIAFDDVEEDNVFYPYISYLEDQNVIAANNQFFPANDITRFEAAKILVSAADIQIDTDCQHEFRDVSSSDAFYKYVKTLSCQDIITQNDQFFGQNNITRAEFTKIAVNVFGIPRSTLGQISFTDIESDNPFASYIYAALDSGVIKGYSDNTFRPYQNILRQESAKIGALLGGFSPLADSQDEVYEDFLKPQESTLPVDLLGKQIVIDKPFQVLSSTSIIAPGQSVMLYMVIRDEYGNPITGKQHDISYVQDGKGTLVTDITTVSNTQGIYAVGYRAGNVAATEVISFEDKVTGDVASVALHVKAPEIVSRPLESNCSIRSICRILVQLTDANGGPITNAISDDRLNFISSNASYARVIDTTDNTANRKAPRHLGGGVYYAEVETFNRAQNVTITVQYTQANTFNDYVKFDIEDYIIDVKMYGKDINAVNGTSVAIITVEDVNGRPPQDFTPQNDLEFRVRTRAAVTSPDGSGPDWTTGNADFEFDSSSGAFITEIRANNSGVLGPVDIEVSFRDSVSSDRQVERTIQLTAPQMLQARYFKINGATQAVDAADFVLVSVVDSDGFPVLDLDHNDDGAGNVANVNNGVKDAGEESYFALNGEAAADLIDAANVIDLGEGLYKLNVGAVEATTIALLSERVNPTSFESIPVTAEVNQSNVVRNVAVFSVDKFVESHSTATAVDARRSAVAMVQLDTIANNGAVVQGLGFGANAVNTTTRGQGALISALLDADTFATTAAAPTATTRVVQAYISAQANIEETESARVTLTNSGQEVERDLTIYSLRLAVFDIDHINSVATEDRNAFVIPYMDGQRIYNYGDLRSIVAIDELEGAADDGTNTLRQISDEANNGLTTGNDDIYSLTPLTAANISSEIRNHPTANLFVFTWTRGAGEEEIGDALVDFVIDGDDRGANTGRLEFVVENPRIYVFANQEQLLASSNETTLTAEFADDQAGVLQETYIYILAFDDAGVAFNLDVQSNASVLDLELRGVSAQMWSPESTVNNRIDDTIALARNIDFQVGSNNNLGIQGVYRAIIVAEEDLGEVSVEVASQFDDSKNSIVSIDVINPTANLLIFPGVLNLQQNFGKLYVMSLLYDQYGRSLTGILFDDEHVVFDIADDEHAFSEYRLGNDIIGSLYVADYAREDLGVMDVRILYNDEHVLAEGQFIVEGSED